MKYSIRTLCCLPVTTKNWSKKRSVMSGRIHSGKLHAPQCDSVSPDDHRILILEIHNKCTLEWNPIWRSEHTLYLTAESRVEGLNASKGWQRQGLHMPKLQNSKSTTCQKVQRAKITTFQKCNMPKVQHSKSATFQKSYLPTVQHAERPTCKKGGRIFRIRWSLNLTGALPLHHLCWHHSISQLKSVH